MPSVGKRYASVVYPLHACCIRSIRRASAHCDFIRARGFELHKTLERMNLPPCTMFCFRKFSPILSISGADENGWSQPRNFARPLCPFCIRVVSVGQWDQAFKAWSHCHYGCREDVKRKKYLAIRWKTLCIRCVPIACVLHTLYPSSIRPL